MERASAALVRLGDGGGVTELIASIISNPVEGEILQTKEVKMQRDGKGSGIVNGNVHDNKLAQKSSTAGKKDTGRHGTFTSKRRTSRHLSWPKVRVLLQY